MKKLRSVLFFAVSSLIVACTSAPKGPPLPTYSGQVNLERYYGKWYEIARLPFSRQEGCHSTTATYSKRDDGRIKVLNECYDGSFTGKLRDATGIAQVVDPKDTTKLEVSFFRPFWGDYWILDLDSNYQWVMIGEPRRRYLWILSRKPTLEKERLEALKKTAVERGYDLKALQMTPQKTE